MLGSPPAFAKILVVDCGPGAAPATKGVAAMVARASDAATRRRGCTQKLFAARACGTCPPPTTTAWSTKVHDQRGMAVLERRESASSTGVSRAGTLGTAGARFAS